MDHLTLFWSPTKANRSSNIKWRSSFVNIPTTWLRAFRAASCNAVSPSPLVILNIILAAVTPLSGSAGRAFARSMRTLTTLEWPYFAAKWRRVSPFLLACNNSGGHISRILSTKAVDPRSLLESRSTPDSTGTKIENEEQNTQITLTKEKGSSGGAHDANNPFFVHHSDHPGMVLVPKLLNGDNYTTWCRSIRLSLGAKNKLGFIEGTINIPSAENNPD
uniref:Retrotransposon Copia-like N-terminal domain-containing protein n=1 Tax=Salix viminalis TaxID=40686 RepID=A0A6N2M8N2_SALVM